MNYSERGYDDIRRRESSHNKMYGSRRNSFSLSAIFGDPFALSTTSIAVCGWIIAMGGSISAGVAGGFPTFTWWGLAFEFFIIIGVIYMIAADAVNLYRFALLACLATATVYTTNSTNNFVYANSPSKAAAAAGHILLSIINIIWILYFGTTDDAKMHSIVDSFAIDKASNLAGNRLQSPTSNLRANPFVSTNSRVLEATELSSRRGTSGRLSKPMNYQAQPDTNTGYPQMFTSAQLGAFENSSDINRPSGLNYQHSHQSSELMGNNSQGMQATADVLAVPTEYPHKAVAIYSYTANPADINEISFEQGEVLEVSDISGRWWQARRATGEVGICPSNYVRLQV